MRSLLWVAFFGASILMPQCMEAQQMKYPETKTVDRIDEYHWIKAPDRFQWLENDVREDQEVADWVAAQNKVTFDYLETLPFRSEIEDRITNLWNYEKFSAPFRVGDVYYLTRNDGLQNQNVLYRMDTLDSEPVQVLDPNSWSKDGTKALGGLAFSDDGRYMAYGIQDGGSDWRTWRVMDTESGDLLNDQLEWLKFGGITWMPDNSGFYYSRFPEPEEGEAFQSTNLNSKVYFHKLGTSQTEDQLVHEDPERPEWGFAPSVTEDGDYLTISVWKGTDSRNQFYYLPLGSTDGKLTKLIDDFANEYTYIGNYGSVFIFKTDLDAPNGKVISIDIDDYSKLFTDHNWKFIKTRDDDYDEVSKYISNNLDIIYIDSLHEPRHVEKLIYLYWKHLNIEGSMYVDDISWLPYTKGNWRDHEFTENINRDTFYKILEIQNNNYDKIEEAKKDDNAYKRQAFSDKDNQKLNEIFDEVGDDEFNEHIPPLFKKKTLH